MPRAASERASNPCIFGTGYGASLVLAACENSEGEEQDAPSCPEMRRTNCCTPSPCPRNLLDSFTSQVDPSVLTRDTTFTSWPRPFHKQLARSMKPLPYARTSTYVRTVKSDDCLLKKNQTTRRLSKTDGRCVGRPGGVHSYGVSRNNNEYYYLRQKMQLQSKKNSLEKYNSRWWW